MARNTRSKYDSRRIWMNTGASAKLKNIALEERTVRRTKQIYRQAQKDIEAQVDQIYTQFGILSKNNRWEFPEIKNPAKRKDINNLIRAIDKAGLTDYVPEALTKRMNVLQVKQMDAWLRIHEAGADSHAATKEALLKTMQNSGKAWADALAAGADSFIGFDRNICGYMMGMNWADGNFSARLWNASEETWEKVRNELTRAMANGQQPETTKAHIRRMLTEAHNPEARGSGGLSYDVERIVRTESAKAATQADLARWREAGVSKVQWHAVFEKNTCSHCADRDGRIYELKEAMLDEPPLHPNCRCYFAAYDEVAAKFPDTTYYKNDDGEYQEIQWAPYNAVIDKAGNLRKTALKVSDYFWSTSPWSTYAAPKTGITYKGELDKEVIDLTERTIKAIGDQYPEIRERLASTFNDEVTLHRGSSTVIGKSLDHIGGLTDPEYHQLTVSYIDRATGGNPLSQMAKQARDQFKAGKWSTPKDNHTIVHELGHVLAVDLKQKRGVDIEQLVIRATGQKDWKNAKMAIDAISRYGAKNPDEAFAELFARMASQDPSLQTKMTARFADELKTARNLPEKRTKIEITEPLKAKNAKISARENLDGLFEEFISSDLDDFIDKYDPSTAMRMMDMMDEKTTKQTSTISDLEKEALSVYAGNQEAKIKWGFPEDSEAYQEINTYHRTGEPLIAGDDEVKEVSKYIDSALEKSTLPKKTTVYRGVDEELMQRIAADEFRRGETFTEYGYMSTTRNESVASGYPVGGEAGAILEIELPAGTHAVDMNKYDTGDDDEILLPRNTRLKILKIEKSGKKKTIKAELLTK